VFELKLGKNCVYFDVYLIDVVVYVEWFEVFGGCCVGGWVDELVEEVGVCW